MIGYRKNSNRGEVCEDVGAVPPLGAVCQYSEGELAACSRVIEKGNSSVVV